VIPPGTQPSIIRKLEALRQSALAVSQFSSLVLTTTEALAYVYENTLISEETRSALGTHSTPSYLVDYVIGALANWIEEIPVDERSVFEPACGHAAFLVSAMRLLIGLLPPEKAVPRRRGRYLRSRLHGTDIDPFALELARLSLSLTDIPNPDGWDLNVQDMFLGNYLAEQAMSNTILLANPPFDNFTAQEQRKYRDRVVDVRFMSKSAETLWRTLRHMPEGGVFGVVIPQTLLYSNKSRELREFLTRECQLKQICLFPDKVFSFSEAESAVLVGRRKRVSADNKVTFLHVRERELLSFQSEYNALNAREVLQSQFTRDDCFSLRVPDLEEVWSVLSDSPVLADIAALAKGLDYSTDLTPADTTYSERRFAGAQEGFVRLRRGLQLHELPRHC
jgi:type I restriction-modification system DNA methylase subunit